MQNQKQVDICIALAICYQRGNEVSRKQSSERVRILHIKDCVRFSKTLINAGEGCLLTKSIEKSDEMREKVKHPHPAERNSFLLTYLHYRSSPRWLPHCSHLANCRLHAPSICSCWAVMKSTVYSRIPLCFFFFYIFPSTLFCFKLSQNYCLIQL